jgi:hypothetical protein
MVRPAAIASFVSAVSFASATSCRHHELPAETVSTVATETQTIAERCVMK